MVQNGPLLSVALTRSLPWWMWSMAGLLRCLSAEGREQAPIVPVSSLHLPKRTGKESRREEALILNQFTTKWTKGVGTAGISRLLFFIIDKHGEVNVEWKYKYQIEANMSSFKCEQWLKKDFPSWGCVSFFVSACAAHDYSCRLQKHASVVKWKLMEYKVGW